MTDPVRDFERWLTGSSTAPFEYHRGYLGAMITPPPVVARIRALAFYTMPESNGSQTAIQFRADSPVHLVQKRHGAFDYSYLAYHRRLLKCS